MTKTYREDFATAVSTMESTMWSSFKAEGAPPIPFIYGGRTFDLRKRDERGDAARVVTDTYVREHAEFNDAAMSRYRERGGTGEGPAVVLTDAALLERIANVILYDEIADENPYKSQHNEYPIMSEIQLARRREGKHQGKREGVSAREVAFGQAYSIGTDGRSYAEPIRRERSNKENIFMDEATTSRVREQRGAYADFIAEKPVVTYVMSQAEREARGWQ
ncbi:hypothetical protein [Paenibacillus sp. FSL L8-0708]|uniref:hypothetical protein n=1 Tax=Paenibacillus sp. FSL L8-0708 TaxID=2975311 RepID=UPI0030FB6CC7